MSTEPRWLTIARKYTGVRETPGSANNPTIMGWAKRVGLKIMGAAYNADSVPWCGLFVANVMTEAGITPPAIAIRAASWDNFGARLSKPYVGAVVRFQRPGGGHVAFIVGQDATHLKVLGGNQSDRVNETWIAKDRVVSIRWPKGEPVESILAPMLKRVGAVSTNEA